MHLFQQLDTDWNRLNAAGEARPACLRWNRQDPALAHVTCAQQLVREIRDADDPARSDQLLSALVRLAPTDQLAARTVLQALLPGMRCLTRKLASCGDADEIDATVVACAWARIRTYPHTRRPRRVAANILLDTRKDALRTSPFPNGREILVADVDSTPDAPSVDGELGTLLQEAIERCLISPDEAGLIHCTRVHGRSLTSEALRRNITTDALTKRRSRAERRLRLVVA